MHRAFVDTLRVPGGGRPVGKRDGLPDPGSVRLDLLPGVLLPDELRVAPGADMHLLHVHADQAVAGRAHQRREPTREETGYQARLRRRRRLRRLLVPYTGMEAQGSRGNDSILDTPSSTMSTCNITSLQVILVTKSLELYPLTTATIMVQIVSHILAYTNSCINPFLYAFLSDNFRKAFRKIIYCRPRTELNNRLGPATRTTRAASTGDIL